VSVWGFGMHLPMRVQCHVDHVGDVLQLCQGK